MFGTDQFKNKHPEEILTPNFTQSSYSKRCDNWKEGKHLEGIFYQVAKDEGVSYQEVKEVFFDAFSKISQYMRHVNLPIIDIPQLGKLVPNMIILSKQIKSGYLIWEKAKEDNPDIEMPFFLKCLLDVQSRRNVEMCVRKPRYIKLKELSDEEILEIAKRVKKSKKNLFLFYINQKYGEGSILLDKINFVWNQNNVELKDKNNKNKKV